MLAIEFRFPAGRYHANPWGQHVNEGAVDWPPEPWRVLRALIATWHQKIKPLGKHSASSLAGLVESLSESLPKYRLPHASHAHTRHYMPQSGAGKTSLVFDAFTTVNRNDTLIAIWPNTHLEDDQAALLDDLLTAMGYLGRAESWVEARRIHSPPAANCTPGTQAVDTETGELKGELITLHAPLAKSEYEAVRARFITDKRAEKRLATTLPQNLLDALSVSTSELQKLGWNQPPAAQKVSYLRPVGALQPAPKTQRHTAPTVTSALFIIHGKPLPRVEDSLRIGETMRVATMAQCKRLWGDSGIPPIFSGHGMPSGNRHGHAFYLPWDSNNDGRIDRLLIHVPDGMDDSHQRALLKIRRLWERGGNQWQLILEGRGRPSLAPGLSGPATVWSSITPYLHPWHTKKNFDVADQIRRECRKRKLPEPVSIQPMGEIEVGKGRTRKPIHFRRFRSRRVNHQPDRHGSFWRITFPRPVEGPLALGFACHYGLGMFKSETP